jgi:hypothetical protein
LLRVEKGLLKSASGASKFVSIQGRMSMKLFNKLGGLESVKTKLLKRLQSMRSIDDSSHA